jgi:hypothetical protein
MSSTPINNGDSGLTARNAINANFLAHDNAKQDTLVSGENLKTINSQTLLGSGDIVISGGGGLTQQQVMRLAL